MRTGLRAGEGTGGTGCEGVSPGSCPSPLARPFSLPSDALFLETGGKRADQSKGVSPAQVGKSDTRKT